ncbi:fatty acid--CoA ligase family protein [Eubacterium sp.]|uniref:ANL family adenylate-forming protein n=1 Tax=Eubacterium sp. TaxID=142586 RepID=UPI003520876E
MDWIKERLKEFETEEALIVGEKKYLYCDVLNNIERWSDKIIEDNVKTKEVVILFGYFSAEMLFAMFALIANKNIIVPIAKEKRENLERMAEISKADKIYSFDNEGCNLEILNNTQTHELIEKVRESDDAGVMIFTSGSTGEGKCSIHKFSNLTYRVRGEVKRRALRTLVFLKMDHIGGINTILSILFQGGTMILINDRTIPNVCTLIEKHKVELLPTTPSFINMMIISGACKDYDLSSLILITYGTEPMSDVTLKALHKELPNVKIRQTYGLTEMGIFPTKSKGNDSVYMKVGGESQVETKIENNIIYIRSPYSMLGYLNAPNPFDEDGWYNTGDEVEIDGEFLHILGRKEEIINVGGEKVFPAEIEGILSEIPNVADVVVRGKKSPVTGQIVTADFCLQVGEDEKIFKKRVIEFCKNELEDYKIPRLIRVVNDGFIGTNLKKKRL